MIYLIKKKHIRQMMFICLFAIGPAVQADSQNYFQQEVNYKIKVALNDTLHELHAFEEMEYINNSPDTLHFIWIHLWPNAYSSNSTDLAKQLFGIKGKSKLFNDPQLSGSIDSLDFKVDNQTVDWSLVSGQSDISRIELNEPLPPGDTLWLTTPFRVKIPKGVTSRLGHIDESYQISQWYPKPAVYDPDGWHPMPYLDQGEFYSEFGQFDVWITIPENYIVGATGTLQTQKEIEMLEILSRDTSWVNSSHIGKVSFPASSKQLKTLHWTAEMVHDFAWFADKRFHVMNRSVILPQTGREVNVWVMFTNRQSNLWKEVLDYVNDAIIWGSSKTGDYPYDTFTAVQSALSAGYGMEYPGITVIGLVEDAYSLDEVLSHELFHNWFYGALASNERVYPYMDEGITSAYTSWYMKEKYPLKKLWQVYFKNWKLARLLNIDHLPVGRMQELEWLVQARNNLEQPVNLPATWYNDLNYAIVLYNKAAMAFNYLRAYLGDSVYEGAMHSYYENWKFKHPQPEDLRTEFENAARKDLGWFFDDLIGTTKRLDYKMVRTDKNQLLVKNKGELESPVIITGMTGDSVFFEKWVDGFSGSQWITLPEGDYSEIRIDPGHLMPELYRMNNQIRTTGMFPRADPIKPQLLFTLEDPEKYNLMFLPALNWTRENGFMAGVALHNGFIIPKSFEYFVMPFYAFGNHDLAGYGKLAFNIKPHDHIIRLARISLEGIRFGAPGDQNYQKLKTGIELNFRRSEMTSPYTHKVYGDYIVASNLHQIIQLEGVDHNAYFKVGYELAGHSPLNPFSLQTDFESGKSYQKASAEFNYRMIYPGKEKGLDIRLFAGAMLKEDSEIAFYSFSPDGRSGRDHYFYQGTYPDRFAIFPSNFWSRQMTLSEGGMVTSLSDTLGYSSWMVSCSFTSTLPGKLSRLPVQPFVHLLFNDKGFRSANDSPVFFEAGLKTGIRKIFEIYVPLVVSKNLDESGISFRNRIRFVLSLDAFGSKWNLTSKM